MITIFALRAIHTNSFDDHLILQFMAAVSILGSVCVTLATRAPSARLMMMCVVTSHLVKTEEPATTQDQTAMCVRAQQPSMGLTVRRMLMSASVILASMEALVWLVSACLLLFTVELMLAKHAILVPPSET